MVDRDCGGGQKVNIDCSGLQKVIQWWSDILVVGRRLDIGGQRLWWWLEDYTVVARDCDGGQKVVQ